jgi:hypothetical protein
MLRRMTRPITRIGTHGPVELDSGGGVGQVFFRRAAALDPDPMTEAERPERPPAPAEKGRAWLQELISPLAPRAARGRTGTTCAPFWPWLFTDR